MYHEIPNHWKRLLIEGLEEDGTPWDWTTLGSVRGNPKITAKVFAKSNGVWAGHDLARTLPEIHRKISLIKNLRSGEPFFVGDLLLHLEGPLRPIFALERPFLNLAAYSSGICTATAGLVKRVQRLCPKDTPRITLTRKTLPGYRDVAIQSVILGGGFPHRLNLASGILIKENHIAAAGGIQKAVEGVRQIAPHGLRVEVEVRNLKELALAIKAGVEGVLLDNFGQDTLVRALKELRKLAPKPFVEVSGGIHEGNVGDYALPGVDVISVGNLTHSVKSSDFTWLVERK